MLEDDPSARPQTGPEESNSRAAAGEQANLAFRPFFGRGTGPKRLEMAVGFIWVDSRGLATILDPFRTIFRDLAPDRLSAT